MRFIIAQRRLASPGGSETFVLTVAEHLSKLGHDVSIWSLELGLAAKIAQERVIGIIGDERELPAEADASIALDQAMAIELARRYPSAARLYAMHTIVHTWFPPPEPGIVAATLAPNDRFELCARACVGSGTVMRIRQPIDLVRFAPRGSARERPSRILVVSNYLQFSAGRIAQLRNAWSAPGLEWRFVGHPKPSIHIANEMAAADIVVGYGRSILEAMACGRPAYVHDHSGSDGWVTDESYARLEADGFAGTGVRSNPSLEELREDFRRYKPELGRIGHDLVRTHHDARLIAAEIADLVNRLGVPPHRNSSTTLDSLRNLADGVRRAELEAEGYRLQLKDCARKLTALQGKLDKETTRFKKIRHSRRFRLVQAVFWPIDWLRSLITKRKN
jgi:hypothetical protein